MHTTENRLVIANWKMNPTTLPLAQKLARETKKAVRSPSYVDVVIAPPFPFLVDTKKVIGTAHLSLGAQDVFTEVLGAYTGEVSLSMLKSIGVSYVIIGHSERRKLGMTDAHVKKTIEVCIKGDTTAVVCIGEHERDAQGTHFGVVETQLKSALFEVPKTKLSKLVIAYEPVWAIGTGNTATPEDVYEMYLFIQRILADTFGRKSAEKVRILYGGSVDKKNAAELLEKGGVHGFLVGGASLRAAEFGAIVKAADSI